MAEKEYIEREAALRDWPLCDEPADAYQFIRNYPAADVRPVVKGTWKQIGPKEAVCTACNAVTLTNGIDNTGKAHIHKALYRYCPNCGADMRKDGEA